MSMSLEELRRKTLESVFIDRVSGWSRAGAARGVLYEAIATYLMTLPTDNWKQEMAMASEAGVMVASILLAEKWQGHVQKEHSI